MPSIEVSTEMNCVIVSLFPLLARGPISEPDVAQRMCKQVGKPTCSFAGTAHAAGPEPAAAAGRGEEGEGCRSSVWNKREEGVSRAIEASAFCASLTSTAIGIFHGLTSVISTGYLYPTKTRRSQANSTSIPHRNPSPKPGTQNPALRRDPGLGKAYAEIEELGDIFVRKKAVHRPPQIPLLLQKLSDTCPSPSAGNLSACPHHKREWWNQQDVSKHSSCQRTPTVLCKRCLSTPAMIDSTVSCT